MLRHVVLVCCALGLVAGSAAADSFTTEESFLAAIDVSAATFEGWDSYADGTTISNGQTVNGVTYNASSSIWRFAVDRDARVTDDFGFRSPENSLGLELDLGYFGTHSTPFVETFLTSDSITFSFDQSINSFGISFLNTSSSAESNAYTITTSSIYHDFTATAVSGPDAFYDDRGQFAGIVSDTFFDSVTISITGTDGWNAFVLDNMWTTAAPTGFLGGFINTGGVLAAANYATLLPGSQLGNPLLSTDFPGYQLQDPFDESTFGTYVLAGEFFGQSPHLYTENQDPIDPDIQAAVTAAFTDLQFGGVMFHDYVQRLINDGDPRPELQDLLFMDLSEPGSTIQGLPVDVWLGFVATYNPNRMFDPNTGLPFPDPDFETRLANWWNDPEIQASVQGGTIEQIIFPHDEHLNFPGLQVTAQFGFDQDGKPTLTSGGFSAAVVPEPGTVATFGAALAFAAVALRRRRRKIAA